MINYSGTPTAVAVEEAALEPRFRSTKQNSTDRATQAEEAACEAAQAAYATGHRTSDSRTFTPAVRRLLRAAQDAMAAANYLRLHP